MNSAHNALMKKIKTMMILQDKLNCKVNQNWIELRRPWCRPSWIEAAELMNHLKKWKWWGNPQADMNQALMEVIDILHFLLSSLIESYNSDYEAAIAGPEIVCLLNSWVEAPNAQDIDFETVFTTVENFAKFALIDNSASCRVMESFGQIASLLQLPLNDAYKIYMAKNTLNIFRQDHGYKDGTYVKVWNGREDNEHLDDILQKHDIDSATFFVDVMNDLEQTYQELCHAA